jgi:phosphatidylglycerol:prolipoprotein diacylglycerol transferase
MNYIEFPMLGLKFSINSVAFNIFGKDIYWYGIIITLGFIIGIFIARKRSGLYGITWDNVLDFIIYAIPFGIIGARTYYVIFSWDLYKDNPIEIFKIWNMVLLFMEH